MYSKGEIYQTTNQEKKLSKIVKTIIKHCLKAHKKKHFRGQQNANKILLVTYGE